VFVRDGNITQAIKLLTKKLGREKILQEERRSRRFEAPSARRRRKRDAAIRRRQKEQRRRAIWEGLISAPDKRKAAR
jgi:small subunit ribosomal protein S21